MIVADPPSQTVISLSYCKSHNGRGTPFWGFHLPVLVPIHEFLNLFPVHNALEITFGNYFAHAGIGQARIYTIDLDIRFFVR